MERERERERETRVSDNEGVRREKVKELIMRERMRQKIIFSTVTNEDNIYKRCNV